MKIEQEMSSWVHLRRFVALMFLAMVAIACSRDDSLRWTEDVLLPDGRTITLTRYHEFKGPHEIGDTPSISNYWFEFVNPDTGEKVRWENDRTHSTAFLQIHDKVPLLLIRLTFGGYDKFNCPNPSFLLYAYRDGHWSRQPLESIPIKKVKPNMTSNPKQMRETIVDKKRHLAASDSGADRIVGTEVWRMSFEELRQQTFGEQNCALDKGMRSANGIQEP